MDPATLEMLKSSAGLVGIPLVVIGVEQAKKAAPNWPGYAWPLMALVIAVLLNVAIALAMATDPYVALVVGVIVGFLSMSVYDKAQPPPPPRG